MLIFYAGIALFIGFKVGKVVTKLQYAKLAFSAGKKGK